MSSGWLHRDVKPANFVRTKDSDPAAGGEWRILDFGLARQYISKDGLIVDAREGYNEFRGSTNYASIKAHQKEELGATSALGVVLAGHPQWTHHSFHQSRNLRACLHGCTWHLCCASPCLCRQCLLCRACSGVLLVPI